MINRKKHVALFLPNLEQGGAQRVMVNLARGLVESGCEVDLVLADANGPLLEDVPAQVKVVDLKVRRLLYAMPKLVRYLKRERPSVLLSTLYYANVVAVLARRWAGVSTRLVVREANTLTEFCQRSTSIKKRLLFRLMRWAYPQADAVVANSRETKEDLLRCGIAKSSQVHVIYNPVVTPETITQTEECPGHRWLIEKELPVVIGVGRLAPQKGFDVLIRAFSRVQDTVSSRLLLVGEGPLRGELEELVRELGLEERVALTGFVRNPLAYIARSDVFVLSSNWEGFGNVLVEALASKTPIVATDCPGGPREILDGGRFGQLVPVGDDRAISVGIVNAFANGCDGESLRRRAFEFDLKSIRAQYRELCFPSTADQPLAAEAETSYEMVNASS